MFCDHRNEIVDIIQQVYWIKVCNLEQNRPKLNMFGVSSKELNQYVTSEKDAIRRINRMPSSYFLLNNQADAEKALEDKDKTDEEFDDLFDEFVMIDREELSQKLNLEISKEKLAKEEKVKNESAS